MGKVWIYLGIVVLLVVAVFVAACGSATTATTPLTYATTTTTVQTTGPTTTVAMTTTTGAQTTTTMTPAQTTTTTLTGGSPSSAEAQDLATRVGASLVSVEMSIVENGQNGETMGSGLVYSSDGIIITLDESAALNSKTPPSITVTLPSGVKAPATVIAKDAASDLVLLKVNATGLSPVSFSTGAVAKGDWVMAIAAAGTRKVTTGRVSGTNGTLPAGFLSTSATTGLLETDLALVPGGAGGGLFDAKGALIGMPVASVGGTAVALPSATVLAAAQRLSAK